MKRVPDGCWLLPARCSSPLFLPLQTLVCVSRSAVMRRGVGRAEAEHDDSPPQLYTLRLAGLLPLLLMLLLRLQRRQEHARISISTTGHGGSDSRVAAASSLPVGRTPAAAGGGADQAPTRDHGGRPG